MTAQSSLIIVGFGSQARAWALNLRDSHIDFKIALQPNSKSAAKVESMGFKSINLESSDLNNATTFLMLIPDDTHLSFFQKNKEHLKAGAHFVYAHGFSLSKERLDQKYSQFSHSLLAPKAIASEVRFQYESKGKIGAAIFAPSPECDNELRTLAKALHFTALYPSSFDEECMADLFSEQSLLCSILPYAALKSYNLLRKNGISAEIAFMECFLELKSISQALVQLGPQEFFNMISPNALLGSQKGRELLTNAAFDTALEKIFTDIKTKKFYEEVEVYTPEYRARVVSEWDKEEFSAVFKRLKPELIV